MQIWKNKLTWFLNWRRMKGAMSISTVFSPSISSPSRALFLPHSLIRLGVILILKNWFDFILFSYSKQQKTASTKHYKLQNPSFFLRPCSPGDFQSCTVCSSPIHPWASGSQISIIFEQNISGAQECKVDKLSYHI